MFNPNVTLAFAKRENIFLPARRRAVKKNYSRILIVTPRRPLRRCSNEIIPLYIRKALT